MISEEKEFMGAIFGNYRINYSNRFSFVYIVSMVIMFSVKTFKVWCKKIAKRGDAQGGIRNK